MTRQEIFNTVARKLITQGVASADEGGACLYRGPNGTKCAVGHLIPDEKYNEALEGRGARFHTVMSAAGISDEHEWLVGDLQDAHDADLRLEGVDVWKRRMLTIATNYGLDASVLG